MLPAQLRLGEPGRGLWNRPEVVGYAKLAWWFPVPLGILRSSRFPVPKPGPAAPLQWWSPASPLFPVQFPHRAEHPAPQPHAGHGGQRTALGLPVTGAGTPWPKGPCRGTYAHSLGAPAPPLQQPRGPGWNRGGSGCGRGRRGLWRPRGPLQHGCQAHAGDCARP